jgi:hypothetical protein
MTNKLELNRNKLQIAKENGPNLENNNPMKWLYIACTVISISVTICILTFVALETKHQMDRQIISGVENNSNISTKSMHFKKLLDDKLNGKSVDSCIKILYPENSDINVKRMIIGFETFKTLNEYVTKDDDIDYDDLRLEIKPFLEEVRSSYNISSDTLYFGYMARDIIFYIFDNEDVFLIHDNDISLMGSDGKSLKAFYEDATTVFNFLKEIENRIIKNNAGFFKDPKNGNLFLIAMYCKARYVTSGRNDKSEMESIIQSIEDNKFRITGQTTERLKWLADNLKSVDNDLFKPRVDRNRPDFISSTWLK